MALLGSRQPAKRDHGLHRSPSVWSNICSFNGGNNVSGSWGQRLRSRFARLVFFKKIDYVQLICVVAVFFFVIFLFQMFFLPGSVMDDDGKFGGIRRIFRKHDERSARQLSFLKDLDFGENVNFEPLHDLAKFGKDDRDVNDSVLLNNVTRFGYKKPRLALVFGDLMVDPHQILMVTVASALREIGYEIEVFSLDDGPVYSIWREVGLPTNVITADGNMKFSVDWLNYHGIMVNSLKAVGVLPSLMQEPFTSVPLVWTIHEETLAVRLRKYVSSGRTEMVDSWRKVFQRASVIVFPNYILPVAYSACDPGNYFVIPGSPARGWEAEKFMDYEDIMHSRIRHVSDDFRIAIVGSQLLYGGLWLEHAFILQALYPVLTHFSLSTSHLEIFLLAANSSSNYSRAVEIIARNLKYPNGTVKHVTLDENTDSVLNSADLVIYGSFLEEHAFPDTLLKAMCLGKPVVAPDLPMTRKYVSDRVNGFLFPKEDIKFLTELILQLVPNRRLSPLARYVAKVAKRTAKDLMVSESVEGYASLLEYILMLPSEVAASRAAQDIPAGFKTKWLWHYFEPIGAAGSPDSDERIHEALDDVEEEFNRTRMQYPPALLATNDTNMCGIWEEQDYVDMVNMIMRREYEELKDRTDQPRGTWDEVYRNVRRSGRPVPVRDEGELMRTGQPLCIYEPFHGEGAWPFLHNKPLYRGLSTKDRRPGGDDVDAPARLSLLKNAYYRDILGELGAFFAVANRIDRIHKNAWIGFQSWRATARSVSLSENAERLLVEAIESRIHGDTLYFWSSLDMDSRHQPEQDFWSFCDAINSGNCRFVFSEALKRMYGVKNDLILLPQMPSDGGTWSVMHCWVAPTRSFLEFVMFSRMFVDALHAHFSEHRRTGQCQLSLTKDKHCYSRMLELLVNVWAYHSARRMVYVQPETGLMREQHELDGRRGRMWVKWFEFGTLKSMDEELAEEFDTDRPRGRRLWPWTGEVFWRGVYEKERIQKIKARERKKQLSREKLQRMRKRTQQKVLGKYVMPIDDEESNTTNATTPTPTPEAKLLR